MGSVTFELKCNPCSPPEGRMVTWWMSPMKFLRQVPSSPCLPACPSPGLESEGEKKRGKVREEGRDCALCPAAAYPT